jgi:hypothetical protein
MNAIKSLARNSNKKLVKLITECDGRFCEDVGMAALGITTIALMFSAISQIA